MFNYYVEWKASSKDRWVNTITTRFMSRVVIFFQSAACALRTAYDLRLASRPYLKPDNFV